MGDSAPSVLITKQQTIFAFLLALLLWNLAMFELFTPKNPKTLHAVIRNGLGFNVPRKAVCPGHNAPFDFIADSFFETANNCLVIGPRTGGKTLDYAILEFLESVYKPGCDSCHLGAIMAQAERAYKYVSKWSNKHRDKLGISTSTKKQTILGNHSSIEIVPGTVNGVNSPHPHKASIDEFELLPWDIFQEAISMPHASAGIPSALRLATTRKYPSGNAQTMIEESDKRGFKVYKWCVFEVLNKCTRGNCKDCAKYVSYTREGNPVKWSDVCGGKAKNADGYLVFDDVIAKFLTLDWETFNAQWLCERPERSNSVFSEFNYGRNVLENWEINPNMRFGRGWDFGFDDPTAVLFFQFDGLGNIYLFDEIVTSGQLIDDIAVRVRAKSDGIADVKAWEDWGDPSGHQRSGIDHYSYISKLARHDIRVNSQFSSISDGIQAVQRKLRINSFSGQPQLYVTKNCRKTINALEMAQWDRTKGENEHSHEKYKHDEHSHPLDALRYFVSGVSIKNKFTFG